MAREKGIRLTLDADPAAVYASMDRVAFERVVGNLLANAIRETDEGSVTLQVRERDEGPDIQIETTSDAPLEHASDAGAADASSGDLLQGERPGLAVAKQLLTMMGGAVSASTCAEGGRRYRIRFTDTRATERDGASVPHRAVPVA
jgi:C4-dicarboxylate-specific signal transduction histidine kinase